MKKISIIIPFHNSEKYIETCIKSVLAQSYHNWEAILVDDGSTDSGLSIVEKYSAIDKRLKVIKQKNLGPGNARNNALKKCKGDYVVFLDSDDFIRYDYLEQLSSRKEDIVFIDVRRVSEHGAIIKNEKISKYKYISKEEIIKYQITGKIPWGAVRKAVKKKVIDDSGASFSSDKIGEEALYSFDIVNNAKTIAFLSDPLYFYVQHDNSQSRLKIDNPWGHIAEKLEKKIKENGSYEKYAKTINSLRATSNIIYLRNLAPKINYKRYKVLAKETIQDNSASLDIKSMKMTFIIIYALIKIRQIYPTYIVLKGRNK